MWLSSQALNSARYPALASGDGTGAGTGVGAIAVCGGAEGAGAAGS